MFDCDAGVNANAIMPRLGRAPRRPHTFMSSLPARPRLDLVLPLLAATIAATAGTWLLFRLSRGVERWTGRQLALVWLCGLCAVVVLGVATAHVPTTKDLYTARCDPARDPACRATAAPQVSATGDTVCCYPGVTEFTIEHTTTVGEAAKISLIMLLVGTLIGLFILTNQWIGRPAPSPHSK